MSQKSILRTVLRIGLPIIIIGCQAFLSITVGWDLLNEPPEGDEVLLAGLLIYLIYVSLFSCVLWLPEEKVNGQRIWRWLQVFNLVISGLVLLVFVYSSWILTVVVFFIFFLWIKHSLQKARPLVSNIVKFAFFILVLDLYLIWMLFP